MGPKGIANPGGVELVSSGQPLLLLPVIVCESLKLPVIKGTLSKEGGEVRVTVVLAYLSIHLTPQPYPDPNTNPIPYLILSSSLEHIF